MCICNAHQVIYIYTTGVHSLHGLTGPWYTFPWMKRKHRKHCQGEVLSLPLLALKLYPCRCTMVLLRSKFLAAVFRNGGPPRPSSKEPARHVARRIGYATMVTGLRGAAPLVAVSPPTMTLGYAPDNDVDLNQAKSALRVLSALGDGIAGVPWLKGVAGLGLEIVNTLDVSGPNTNWLNNI